MNRVNAIMVFALSVFMISAIAGHFLHLHILTFVAAGSALIVLSKFLGDATEQLSCRLGESGAGLVNVTLSNIAEIIIIFAAVRANLIELVRGGIVGSIIGNLLLVMGSSIYFGCRKQGVLRFNQQVGSLFINQFFLVAIVFLLPAIFAERINGDRQYILGYFFALMLVGAYLYSYWIAKTDKRFNEIREKFHEQERLWPKRSVVGVLLATTAGAFFMSEFLVGEVETIASTFGISQIILGFIVLPILGNIAEHAVAIFAARKGMAALSLSIAVGSASQVGMIVVPCAILFGYLTGNPVSLNFGILPLTLMGISFASAFLVLKDGEWHESEGIFLLFIYIAMVLAFCLSQ